MARTRSIVPGRRAGIVLIAALFPLVAGFWLLLDATFARAAEAGADKTLAALMNQTERLAFDIDLELSLLDAYLLREAEGDGGIDIGSDAQGGKAAAAAYEEYRGTARWPTLVGALYLVERGPESSQVSVTELVAAGSCGATGGREALVASFYADPDAYLRSDDPPLILARTALGRVERPRDDEPENVRFRLVIAWLDDEALFRDIFPGLAETYFGPGSGFYEYDVAVRDPEGRIRFGERQWAAGGADFGRPLVRDMGRFDLTRAYNAFAPRPGLPSEGVGEKRDGRAIDRFRFQALDLGGLWSVELSRKGLSVRVAAERDARLMSAAAAALLLLLYGSVVALYVSARRIKELASRERSFVASVTHELKTPIAVALSAGENLAKGIVPAARVGAYGDTVAREARRLAESVERLLLVAGLESSPALKGGESVDVAELAGQIAGRLEGYAQERGARFELDLRDAPPVAGSRPLLSSAVECVLGNAVKYAGGVIRVSVYAERRGGRAFAVLRCSDEGPGLRRYERRAVFEPFYRGAFALERGLPGTGVGLYLARRAARIHGGDARIVASPGTGLCMELSFRSCP